MDMNQMRDYISKHPKYRNSPKWKARVMRMPENQVVALYSKFRQLDYNKIEKEMKELEANNSKYHQMDMFEYEEEMNGQHEKTL